MVVPWYQLFGFWLAATTKWNYNCFFVLATTSPSKLVLTGTCRESNLVFPYDGGMMEYGQEGVAHVAAYLQGLCTNFENFLAFGIEKNPICMV
jgi:hypothetical protein